MLERTQQSRTWRGLRGSSPTTSAQVAKSRDVVAYCDAYGADCNGTPNYSKKHSWNEPRTSVLSARLIGPQPIQGGSMGAFWRQTAPPLPFDTNHCSLSSLKSFSQMMVPRFKVCHRLFLMYHHIGDCGSPAMFDHTADKIDFESVLPDRSDV